MEYIAGRLISKARSSDIYTFDRSIDRSRIIKIRSVTRRINRDMQIVNCISIALNLRSLLILLFIQSAVSHIKISIFFMNENKIK